MRSSTCHLPGITHAGQKLRFYQDVGERLRTSREAAGLSIHELARRSGFNTNTIQKAEYGDTCSLYVLAVLAEHLDDVTLDDLVPMASAKQEAAE